jgi:hypothetical protein
VSDIVLNLEISWSGGWVSLNDHVKYKVNAQGTLDQTRKSFRTVKATSPVLSGDYLIHAVPDMVTENVSLWVYGTSSYDANVNLNAVTDMFEQYSYQLRWTFNNMIETWNCQMAEATTTRSQVYAVNKMAQASFVVPRYAEKTIGTA